MFAYNMLTSRMFAYILQVAAHTFRQTASKVSYGIWHGWILRGLGIMGFFLWDGCINWLKKLTLVCRQVPHQGIIYNC